MIFLLISFIGGVLTVLAPCILPLLPVIVGGGLTDGKVNIRKAITIVISLGVSVILFTLLLKVSTLFITIPEYVWNIISGGIITALGIVTIFPSIWETPFMARMSVRSNMLLGKGNQKNSFWGDVIVGAALGPVFSSCSPTYFIVLATVLPVKPLLGLVYLLAYTIGLCIALFVVSFVGQKVMQKLNVASNPNGFFKRGLGVLFLFVGIAILSGFDKKLEDSITSAGFFDATKIEQKLLQKNDTTESAAIETVTLSDESVGEKKTTTVPLSIAQKAARYKKAPELVPSGGFVNTEGKPITLASLKGKVVLLDIWTYSCINCKRTIPYINQWYEKYKDQGFVVVGVHTPEFSFERKLENVASATEKLAIKYPVVLDNEYGTWQALGNQYWPRKYLIDQDGYIIYDHIGEGEYEETEKRIQQALQDRAQAMGQTVMKETAITAPKDAIALDQEKVQSPEVYFGSARNEFLANGTAYTSGSQSFALPNADKIKENKLYLSGTWDMSREFAQNSTVAEIVFPYNAKNVYMVASAAAEPVAVQVYRDGSLVKTVTVSAEQLYTLIEGEDYGKHTLHLVVPKAGLKAFTVTFG